MKALILAALLSQVIFDPSKPEPQKRCKITEVERASCPPGYKAVCNSMDSMKESFRCDKIPKEIPTSKKQPQKGRKK